MFDFHHAEIIANSRKRDLTEQAERERQRLAFAEERKRKKRDGVEEPPRAE